MDDAEPVARPAAGAAGPVAGSAQSGSGDLGPLTLAIDVGGTRLKCGVLDRNGQMVGQRQRVDTPHPSAPGQVMPLLVGMARRVGRFDRISVGFPGVVRAGRVVTAPNLGTPDWAGYDLCGELARQLGAKVRMLNDARVQGLGVIRGRGLECVVTLGTGFGFALYDGGRLAPHLEMGQHPCRKDMTYDQYVGNAALKDVGPEKWKRRVRRVIGQLHVLIDYDLLYVGGGNGKLIDFELPAGVQVVSNDAGILGGVRLWDAKLDDAFGSSDASELSQQASGG